MQATPLNVVPNSLKVEFIPLRILRLKFIPSSAPVEFESGVVCLN